MKIYRSLAPYVRREWRGYTLGFIGSLLRFMIPLSTPLVIKYLFDDLLQRTDMTGADKVQQLMLIAAVMIIAFFLVRGPMEYVRQYFMQKANNNIIKALRRDTFGKVQQLDAGYYADRKSGEIATRFLDDIEKIRGYMTAVFSNIWMESIVLGFVVIAMCIMQGPLALLAVALVATQFVIAHLLSRKFKVSTREMMSYRSILSGYILEKIQGLVVSRLYAAEKQDREVMDQHLDRYEKMTDRQAKLSAVSLSCVNALSDATPLIVVLAGSFLVIDDQLTQGSLLAFYAYVDRMRGPVAALVQAFPTVAEGSVALRRVFEFMATPVEIREAEQPVQLGEFNDSIRFERVSFAYKGREEVISDMSFDLRRGGTYAFVGESGGGKSTILQLLTRMYDVKRGSVRIDGVNIKGYSLASLRERIGIVSQDSFLFSCSVRDNIRLARPDATEEEVEAAAQRAWAHEFIGLLPDGYDTEVGERGVKLSGGQKQRIALARVFLKDPDIVLLDEATSALDNESEKMVQTSIRQYRRGKTIIMIAHRLSTVMHADTIFVVRGGAIIESGSHRSLLEQGGYYRELYQAQNPVNQADPIAG